MLIASPLISDLFGCISTTITLRMTVCKVYFSLKMHRLMMCMNGSILPANDCSSVYLSIVGIAPVCMTVFGFVFSFLSVSCFTDRFYLSGTGSPG